MLHTAELTKLITFKELLYLRALSKDGKGNIYTLADKGITRISTNAIAPVIYQTCTVVMNLARVANNGKRTTALYEPTQENNEKLRANFKEFMGKLLPYNADLDKWQTRRLDYTKDIKTPYCSKYIKLLQRGDKPKLLTIDSKDTHKKEADKRHYNGSVRYSCKSYTINIYDKYKERIDKRTPKEIAEESRYILRVEMQCGKEKLSYIKRKNELSTFGLQGLTTLYGEEVNMMKKALIAIEGGGTYYTLNKAIKLVKQSEKATNIKSELITLLKFVNSWRSVRVARIRYRNDKKFNALLSHLRELNINPVTIPKGWGVSSLPSIMEMIAQ